MFRSLSAEYITFNRIDATMVIYIQQHTVQCRRRRHRHCRSLYSLTSYSDQTLRLLSVSSFIFLCVRDGGAARVPVILHSVFLLLNRLLSLFCS